MQEQAKHKFIELLEQEYPNGVSLDSMTLRLLRKKIAIADNELEALKESNLFPFSNGLWFSVGMIANNDACSAIKKQAESWIEEYHCFSIDRLLEEYSSDLRCISIEDDFSSLLQHFDFTVRSKYGSNWGCQAHLSVKECTSEIVKRIAGQLKEAGGMLNLDDIQNEFPCFSHNALDVIRRKFLPEISVGEADGFAYWRSKEAIHLPDEFGDKVTEAVDTLVELDENITPSKLEFALNLLFHYRVREEYSLQDNATFKRVCAEHYQSEHDVLSGWKNSSSRTTIGGHVGGERQVRSATTFSMLGIPIGVVLIFTKDDSITCTVIDSVNRVEFNGKQWTISKLACFLLNSNVSGYLYFSYQGETLWKRRKRLEREVADV